MNAFNVRPLRESIEANTLRCAVDEIYAATRPPVVLIKTHLTTLRVRAGAQQTIQVGHSSTRLELVQHESTHLTDNCAISKQQWTVCVISQMINDSSKFNLPTHRVGICAISKQQWTVWVIPEWMNDSSKFNLPTHRVGVCAISKQQWTVCVISHMMNDSSKFNLPTHRVGVCA